MALRFISDLHLAADTPRPLAGFVELLATVSATDQLYILGDLFEAWPGDDEDAPWANTVRSALRQCARRAPVVLMHGNRDFMVANEFARQTGVQVRVEDELIIDVGGRPTLLMHGDTLCSDDVTYQKQRRHLRDRVWQAELMTQPLASRRALAASLRGASKAHQANQPASIIDASNATIDARMRAGGVAALIHGHTHRPGIHQHASGLRYVLGAWESCGWQLHVDGRAARLQCFALK